MKTRSSLVRHALPLASILAAALGCLVLPGAAEARVFVGLGLGMPLYGPAPYYYGPPPVYYAPYPYGYPPPMAPPPMAPPPMAPPPVSYAPPGGAPAGQAAGECREYQATSTVDGRPQQVVGTACRQPDGTWRIVQ